MSELRLETQADIPLSSDDHVLKAMREATKQLGLNFDTSERSDEGPIRLNLLRLKLPSRRQDHEVRDPSCEAVR
jgi:hypothetical protein